MKHLDLLGEVDPQHVQSQKRCMAGGQGHALWCRYFHCDSWVHLVVECTEAFKTNKT